MTLTRKLGELDAPMSPLFTTATRPIELSMLARALLLPLFRYARVCVCVCAHFDRAVNAGSCSAAAFV
jgi:hypothetical protein